MAFEGLTEKLSNAFKKLRGKGRLSEADVKESMREIRLALLEADVNYKVVKDFIKKTTERCVGTDVLESLTPAQMIVKIVNEELTALMGSENQKIKIASQPPTVVMLVGLQGAGKTTNGAKLAGLFKKQNKNPLLAACDIYRPAAIKQLEVVGGQLDIPVFHDDQHGTAIVVTAALINALRVVGKKMEDVHIVLNGPGAAGTAIIKMLMTAGAKDIIAVDQFGTLYKGCNSAEAHKNWLGEVTNPRQIKGGLKEALEGADVFIGVSRPGILTTELCKTMNKDAIVFAMANPTPEIMPDEAKAGGVRVMATGRSDFPNQVNNVLCFPGLFKGALSVRARDINNEMKLAAAYAIADLITDADRSEENIIPGAFDPRVAEAVANAVAKAARETGVARL